MNIALSSAAVWLPEGYEEAETIARESGLPLAVVQKKMGIIKKCRATSEQHPSMMAVEAARKALEGMDPLSIDLVIWTGSEYKDHIVWSAGIFVQRELGLKKAWAFDVGARCSTNVVGLKIAKAMMQTHPEINKVLLCGGHRTGDLVDYKDPQARFLYNLADGGSAMVLERGEENPILCSSVLTDGDFSLDVIVPAGGTKLPTRLHPDPKESFLRVPDIEGMRVRLEERTLDNFLHVIKEAATQSMNRPIDYLALLHMKRSAHDAIVERLELKDEQAIYLDHYGHFGAPDQVLSLGLAERRGLLKKGDHVVLASAGIGYTWSAVSLRWDKAIFNQNSIV
jgi:3-oxoacyl-[acyl-carrier-protein] synthase-3